MWPKFSTEKQEKPALQLSLVPLYASENGSETPYRRKSRSKTTICLKLVAVLMACFIFSSSLYYIMVHMAHCARWSNVFQDPEYTSFYEKYVAPVSGEGEKDNEFFKTMFTEIYDGEYDVPENVETYRQRYDTFLTKYEKTYTGAEKEYRFRVYVHNVIEYEMEESRTPWMDYDDTPFTDMTDSELRKMLVSGGDFPSMEGISRSEESLFKNGESRPLEVDWRSLGKVTAIKNQKNCGSCWAFACVAAVESQLAIRKNTTVILSEQQLVDCDSRNNGCHGGYRPYAMSYIVKNGLYPESLYPYLATEKNQCRVLNQTKVFINDYRILSQNEETQADWIAQNGPVTFGMKVIKQMYNYRSGVFEPSRADCEEKSLGLHAMAIVGYGSENGRDYWIVKNSWGSWWGQSGYFKLARGVNACGAAENVVAPLIN